MTVRDGNFHTLCNGESHTERVHTSRVEMWNNFENTRDVPGGKRSRHFVPFHRNLVTSTQKPLHIPLRRSVSGMERPLTALPFLYLRGLSATGNGASRAI